MASIVRGLAVGPATYIVNASDLRPVQAENKLFKFADDTYRIVCSVKSNTCEIELHHVMNWAIKNNLVLHQSKSMELLITAPGIRGAHIRSQLPPPIMDVERVSKLTILGVIINDRLSADDHVTSIIASCSKSLYALEVLNTHGTPASALRKVFQATVMSKLTYCSPA